MEGAKFKSYRVTFAAMQEVCVGTRDVTAVKRMLPMVCLLCHTFILMLMVLNDYRNHLDLELLNIPVNYFFHF